MDLSTTYLGLRLQNPFIVGASPFCDTVHSAWKLQDAGAAALVMRSLFAEQLAPGAPPEQPGEEETGFVDYHVSPRQYVRQLALLKGAVSIPVIASLNGHEPGDWIDYARELEDAGADAIELNFYRVVADVALGADDAEAEMLRLVGRLAGSLRIPVAVKLSPFHSAPAQLAVALELAGAAGLAIFNRFYQPDIDVEEMTARPHLNLSDSGELLLRLRWLAVLSPQVRGSLAATGGVHTSEDAIKALLAGAHAVQLVSVLLRHGPNVIASLVRGLTEWMRRHDQEELAGFRGRLNLARCADATAYERANYVRTLQSWGR